MMIDEEEQGLPLDEEKFRRALRAGMEVFFKTALDNVLEVVVQVAQEEGWLHKPRTSAAADIAEQRRRARERVPGRRPPRR